MYKYYRQSNHMERSIHMTDFNIKNKWIVGKSAFI